MIDPWRWCDADDDTVGDFLAACVQSLIENGGWIHPEARLVARGGSLHIASTGEDGDPLLRVPQTAMLPVTRIEWATDPEVLSVHQIGDWPEEADFGLLLTQVGLLNACGKVSDVAHAHPSGALTMDPAVVEAIRLIKPTFRASVMSPADVLWATRTFKLPAFAANREPLGLPVLDLLNHHEGGAARDRQTPAMTAGAST